MAHSPRIGGDPDKPCPYCGQTRPAAVRCKAKSKRTGKRCTKSAEPGWTVCRYHGAHGGRPPSTFRYSRALHASEELREAYKEVKASGADEFDLTDEILLARARLNAAVTAGTADLKTVNEMLRDITRAIQKNIELKIKLQGLVQKADAERLLRQAIKVIIPFVPDSLKARCFEEIAAVLGGGEGAVLSSDNVIAGELGAGDE